MTLELKPELQRVLELRAASQGLSTEEYAARLLEDAVPAERIERNQRAIEVLRSLREEGDPEEQRETWEYLKEALDADRLSNRKLFP